MVYSPPHYNCTRPCPPRSSLFSFLAVVICHRQRPLTSPHHNSTTYLCPRPLSSHRQTHSVPPSAVCAHILQPHYTLLNLPPQIVFDLHVRHFGRQVHDGRVLQRAQLRPGMDVEFRHEALRDLGPDAEERLERALRGSVRLAVASCAWAVVRTFTSVASVKLKPLRNTLHTLAPYTPITIITIRNSPSCTTGTSESRWFNWRCAALLDDLRGRETSGRFSEPSATPAAQASRGNTTFQTKLPPHPTSNQGDTQHINRTCCPQFVVPHRHHGFFPETRYFGAADPLGCVCLLCADGRGD
jgi:hypothetical protein